MNNDKTNSGVIVVHQDDPLRQSAPDDKGNSEDRKATNQARNRRRHLRNGNKPSPAAAEPTPTEITPPQVVTPKPIPAKPKTPSSCTSSGFCTLDAKNSLDKERNFGLIADIAMGSGIALMGVGVFLYLTGDEKEKESVQARGDFRFNIAPHDGGIQVGVQSVF